MHFFVLAYILGSFTSCYTLKQGVYQVKLLNSREPISDALPKQDSATQSKLALTQEVVAYATAHGLKSEKAYKSFVKIEGNAVSYVVQAAEADKLEAVTWWFPIVGRVPYLGYFVKEDRDDKAKDLLADGYDVATGDVDGFSSLGWFDDPVYSPMLQRNDGDIAHLFFHELTHRTVWVEGNTEFNENLAEFIGELLTVQFLTETRRSEALKKYLEKRDDLDLFHEWLSDLKKELTALYATPMERNTLLQKKADLIEKHTTRLKPKFKSADFVGRKKWNNAYLLGATLYSPDRSKFKYAASCIRTESAKFFLDQLQIELKKAEDPFKALDNMCKKV